MGFSRRHFLQGAMAAGALPLFGLPSMARATPDTLTASIRNASGHSRAYCYVTGYDPMNGRPIFLRADGRSVYYPTSPSSNNAPLAVDCAIPIDADIVLPRVNSGRVYFSLDQPLRFGLNPNPNDPSRPGVVNPSAANPNDPNHDIAWGFCELTFNQAELFANISFVDFVGLPIALSLDDQQVGGLRSGGLSDVADALRRQTAADGAPWQDLVVSGAGGPLRALSPKLTGAQGFEGYMEPYVDRVWQKYRSQDLIIDTQFSYGIDRGRVINDQLTFDGVASFARPTTRAIFNCSDSPFFTTNDEKGNLSARLAAGLNRTILLDSDRQPADVPYYQNARTNHYARIVHDVEAGGLGYAFPYDDVHPSGGQDVEGNVRSSTPQRFAITLNAP